MCDVCSWLTYIYGIFIDCIIDFTRSLPHPIAPSKMINVAKSKHPSQSHQYQQLFTMVTVAVGFLVMLMNTLSADAFSLSSMMYTSNPILVRQKLHKWMPKNSLLLHQSTNDESTTTTTTATSSKDPTRLTSMTNCIEEITTTPTQRTIESIKNVSNSTNIEWIPLEDGPATTRRSSYQLPSPLYENVENNLTRGNVLLSMENKNWDGILWRAVVFALCATWASNFAVIKLVIQEPGMSCVCACV